MNAAEFEWEMALKFQDGEIVTPEMVATGIGLFDPLDVGIPVARMVGDDEWSELGDEFIAEYDHLVNPDFLSDNS